MLPVLCALKERTKKSKISVWLAFANQRSPIILIDRKEGKKTCFRTSILTQNVSYLGNPHPRYVQDDFHAYGFARIIEILDFF